MKVQNSLENRSLCKQIAILLRRQVLGEEYRTSRSLYSSETSKPDAYDLGICAHPRASLHHLLVIRLVFIFTFGRACCASLARMPLASVSDCGLNEYSSKVNQALAMECHMWPRTGCRRGYETEH